MRGKSFVLGAALSALMYANQGYNKHNNACNPFPTEKQEGQCFMKQQYPGNYSQVTVETFIGTRKGNPLEYTLIKLLDEKAPGKQLTILLDADNDGSADYALVLPVGDALQSSDRKSYRKATPEEKALFDRFIIGALEREVSRKQ
jgi:hypothetical protein